MFKAFLSGRGPRGSVWITGSGVPSSTTGKIQDMYIDTSSTALNFYQKTNQTTWTLQGQLGNAAYAQRGNPIYNVASQGLRFLPPFPFCVQNITCCANELTSLPSLIGLTFLQFLICYQNELNQSNVDSVLVGLDNLVNGGGGMTGGYCDIHNNTAPSSVGLAAVTDLVNNFGWTIIHD